MRLLQDEISQLKTKQAELESVVTSMKAEHENDQIEVWSSCDEEENSTAGATGLQ